MQSHIRAFWLALQFLTVLPTPKFTDLSEKEHQRAIVFFPAVGLVIGLILVLCFVLTQFMPTFLQASVLLSIWILLTGNLHIDGLSDSADAWVGGLGSKQRTLEIMKDVHAGPAGVTAIILTLIVHFAAIVAVVETNYWQALLLAPALARLVVLVLYQGMPYVREQGIGSVYVSGFTVKELLFQLLGFLGLGFILVGGEILLVFLLIAIFIAIFHFKWTYRIDGITGDVAGAAIVLVELITMIAFATIT